MCLDPVGVDGGGSVWQDVSDLGDLVAICAVAEGGSVDFFESLEC